MIKELQLCDINIVSGSACLCIQTPHTIAVDRSINEQDICSIHCCDTYNKSIEWEVFNKMGGNWYKKAKGICSNRKNNPSISNVGVVLLEDFVNIASR